MHFRRFIIIIYSFLLFLYVLLPVVFYTFHTTSDKEIKVIFETDTAKGTEFRKGSINNKLKVRKFPVDRRFNDIARYIAGLTQEQGSELFYLQKDNRWLDFSTKINKAWMQIDSMRLKPMSRWAKTELTTENAKNLDVLYPLSGPDYLHVSEFFPEAKHYRFYALEIAGTLPYLNRMSQKAIDNYLDRVYNSLGDIFKRSYFITAKMANALNSQNLNGVLPIISIFLVRTNHEIVNVKYFHLNDDGSESPLKQDSVANHYNDFVRVYFTDKNDTTLHNVTYLKCDISDGKFQKNKGLRASLNNMPESFTYIKSGSYLLHTIGFSLMRYVIMNKSQTILEDDTGIPYQYFLKDAWNITLYGVYVNPVKNFTGMFQPDLYSAYHDTLHNRVKKLPFSLGYHWGTNLQNLIKAERKG